MGGALISICIVRDGYHYCYSYKHLLFLVPFPRSPYLFPIPNFLLSGVVGGSFSVSYSSGYPVSRLVVIQRMPRKSL